MFPQPLILDHIQNVVFDPSNPPFNNAQALPSNYAGLNVLALTVREHEIDFLLQNPGIRRMTLGGVPDVVSCSFNWFSVTLVNYLRLVGLVQLMNTNSWKSDALVDPKNRKEISSHCREYVKEAVPAVFTWRNKVAAHFAATDPFRDDNLGTLEQSVMNLVTYGVPYYCVGQMNWHSGGHAAELPKWALTKVYEDLAPRFWPQVTLPSLPPTS